MTGAEPQETLGTPLCACPHTRSSRAGSWALLGTAVPPPFPSGGSAQPREARLSLRAPCWLRGWGQGLLYPLAWSAGNSLAQRGTEGSQSPGQDPRGQSLEQAWPLRLGLSAPS